MKPVVSRVVVAAGALVVATLLVGDMVLDAVVSRSVGKVGGQLTGTELTLDGAGFFLFSGSGAIKNLNVANPAGYSQTSAFQIGKISVGLRPESVFQDMLRITQIRVLSPLINFEGTVDTNNLMDILKNVEAILSNSSAPPGDLPQCPGKRMFVDDLWITGAQLNVAATLLGAPPLTLSLPNIHLTSLGTGTNGLTSAELAQIVLSRLTQDTREALAAGLVTNAPKSFNKPARVVEPPPHGDTPLPAPP
jgi:hypothetical protein